MNTLTESEKKELTLAAMTIRTPQQESDWWKQTLEAETTKLKGMQH